MMTRAPLRASSKAAVAPVKPPPMIATSAFRSPWRDDRAGAGGAEKRQADWGSPRCSPALPMVSAMMLLDEGQPRAAGLVRRYADVPVRRRVERDAALAHRVYRLRKRSGFEDHFAEVGGGRASERHTQPLRRALVD